MKAIFVEGLVAYLSGVCTLSPGGLIFTGTPPERGAARRPRVSLRPGDVLEVEIDPIGVLRNTVAAEAPVDSIIEEKAGGNCSPPATITGRSSNRDKLKTNRSKASRWSSRTIAPGGKW